MLCNDAQPAAGGALGDPTETALLDRAGADGIDIASERAAHPRLDALPFDADAQADGDAARRG